MPADGPRSPSAHPSAPRSAGDAATSAQPIQIDANLLRSGYQALGLGDERPLASLLHEKVEWRGVQRGFLRRRALCHGRDEVVQALRHMVAKGKLADPNRWRLHDILVVGDLAAVTFSWVTPAATTIHLAHVVRLASGQIVAIQDHASHTRALRRIRGRASGRTR